MKCRKCPKFDPSIVIVRSGLPAATVEGEIDEIDGDGTGVCVTVKGTELEVATRVPSIWSHTSTRNLVWTGMLNNAAGTIAVSCEVLTIVEDSSVSVPLSDQSTLLIQ